MSPHRRLLLFINVGHFLDHLFMLIYPMAVLGMGESFGLSYGDLIALSLGGFIAFGAGAAPAGWLGDRWSRRRMMAVFFIGAGVASILVGMAQTPLQVALGLTLLGLFAAIYHPVGSALLVASAEKLGVAMGVNGVWGNMGVAFSALIAGALTQWLGWRWAFIAPGMVALALGAVYLAAIPQIDESVKRPARVVRPPSRGVLARVFSVMAIFAICGGVIFTAVTVALPKLFAERLAEASLSPWTLGLVVCAVFMAGAVAQAAIGRSLDRKTVKQAMLPLALSQPVFLAAISFAEGWLLIPAALGAIYMIFGQVTVNDGVIARYVDDAWRSRVFAARYVLAFGASAAAAPLVGYMHDHGGGFGALFLLLAACALLVSAGALALPYRREEIEPASA